MEASHFLLCCTTLLTFLLLRLHAGTYRVERFALHQGTSPAVESVV